MKLGLSSPGRTTSASPWASRPSVLGAVTPVAARALVRITSSAPSRMLTPARPSTPVLSIATGVPPSWGSHSHRRRQSAVRVEQVRPSFFPSLLRHATTLLACTAIPPPHDYRTSLVLSLRSRPEHPHESRVCSAGSQQQGVVPGRLSGQAHARARGTKATRPLARP